MNKRLRKALKGLTDMDLERRRRAMESFMRETYEPFISFLYRYLGNEEECEDVLADVYTDMLENPRDLHNVTNEKELLNNVYMYYMRKRLRQVYKRINRYLHLPQKDLDKLMAPDRMRALDLISNKERRQVIYEVLNRLRSNERRAIELWMEGMSTKAIAIELKTTVGAVKMLIFRTKLKLKKWLYRYFGSD